MKKFLVLFAAVLMLLSLVACGEGANTAVTTDSVETTATIETTLPAETESTAAFVVKVVDEKLNPVSGVMIQICKDTCIPMVTDSEGIASFNIEVTAEHKLSVLNCPEGYVYTGEAEVYMEDGATEYTLQLNFQ